MSSKSKILITRGIKYINHVIAQDYSSCVQRKLNVCKNICQKQAKTRVLIDGRSHNQSNKKYSRPVPKFSLAEMNPLENRKGKGDESVQVQSNLSSSPTKQFYRRILPDVCIGFGSDEGKQIFKEALTTGYMESYFGLAAQFRTQDEPAFCGLSSLVMALNTLEIDPKRVWKGVWRWYHEYMLDCCVPLKVVESKGVTLEQMGCLATCNTLNVSMVHAKPPHTEEDFRNTIKHVVQTTDEVLIVSYSRQALKQTGDGHFSPIAGYHPEKDLVLILDTARFKYPPYWVTVSLLWKALEATDKETGQPRGYMVVSKSQTSPLIMFKISPVISVNMPLLDSEKSSVSCFLESWNNWLNQPFYSQVDENILKTAVSKLLHSLTNLKSSVLTTQVDMKCSLSDEHQCVVKDLVQSLESSDIFHMVKDCISSSKIQDLLQELECCSEMAENSDALSGCEKCNFTINLQKSHFLSMLLLSWPYTKCGSTIGNQLCELSTSQIVKASVALQNEVTLLRQQLNSVLGYLNKCDKCKKGCQKY